MIVLVGVERLEGKMTLLGLAKFINYLFLVIADFFLFLSVSLTVLTEFQYFTKAFSSSLSVKFYLARISVLIKVLIPFRESQVSSWVEGVNCCRRLLTNLAFVNC